MRLTFTFLMVSCLQTALVFGQVPSARVVVQLGQQRNLISGEIFGGDVFSPDSKFVLTYGSDGSYLLWDIQSGREMQHFYTGRMPLTSNADKYTGYSSASRPSISAGNKYCLTEGTESHTYLLWDIASGQKIKEFGSKCMQAVFSPDGKFVVTNSANYAIWTVGLYNIEKKEYNAYWITYKGAARSDGKIAVWGKQNIHMNFNPYRFAVSADLTKIALGLYDGRAVAFDVDELKKKSKGKIALMKDMQVVTPGELSCVTNIAFSDDSKSLIFKNENVAMVWDMIKRKLVQNIAIPSYKSLTDSIVTEGRQIYTKDSYMSDDCRTLAFHMGSEKNPAGKISFYSMPDNGFLYTIEGGYYTNNNRIGDTVTINAISGISNNRKYYYLGYSGNESTEILGADGRIVQLLQSSTISLTNSGFLDNGNKAFIGKPLNDAFLFDFRTGECKRLRNFFYDADTSYGGGINQNAIRTVEYGKNICFSADESLAVTFDVTIANVDQYICVWDVKTQKVIRRIPMDYRTMGLPPYPETKISNDKKNILITNEGLLYNLSTGKSRHIAQGSAPVFSDDNRSLIYGESKSIDKVIHRYIKTIDLATLKTVKSVELKYTKAIPDQTDSIKQAEPELGAPNYNYVYTPLLRGNKVFDYADSEIVVSDVTTGKELMRITDAQTLDPFNRKNVLDGSTWTVSKDGTLLASAGERDNRKIYVYDVSRNGKVVNTFSGYSNDIVSLAFSPDEKRLISTSADKTAMLWDLPSNREVFLFVAYGDDDYAITTPEGYYMATKKGVQALHFVKDMKPYLFSQFDLQYNRPDKVMEKIGMASPQTVQAYKKAYQKRLEKMGFDSTNFETDISFNAPKADVANKPDTVQQVTSHQYKMSVHAKDKVYSLDRLNVLANGVQVFGSKGFNLKKYHSKEQKTDLAITLSSGLNVVEVSVLNQKGIESLSERFEVNCTAPFAQPDLYVVAIGDSKYNNPSLNLAYAAKDAEDVTTLFKGSNKYGKVIPMLLTNENVTRENVLKVKDILLKSAADDKVIVFYAGHGVFNNSMDYYLGTTNIDFMNPQKGGLLYEDLESLLDSIPARNKILLVDACHSGEYDKEETSLEIAKNTTTGPIKFRAVGDKTIGQIHTGLDNSFEMMKQLFTDLRKSTGATVISSAGGGEYAMEGDKWKNSVFTYCLLSGMKEMKADLNHDGKILVSELEQYVQKQVQELTSGKQTPTSRFENSLNDFQIW